MYWFESLSLSLVGGMSLGMAYTGLLSFNSGITISWALMWSNALIFSAFLSGYTFIKIKQEKACKDKR